MSTRANIIVKDGSDELIFYRHSDGYPEGAMPTLEKFLDMIKSGQLRDNVGQAAGWLIILGREEYGEARLTDSLGYSWKVGAIEPTTGIHGDIEFLYVIDLTKKTITHSETGRDADYNATVPAEFYRGKFALA